AAEAQALAKKIRDRQAQLDQATAKPGRLQLALALLTQEEPNWIAELLKRRQMRVHVYHLDAAGRLEKLCEVNDVNQPKQLAEAVVKINALEPHGRASPLGDAVNRVLDRYASELA